MIKIFKHLTLRLRTHTKARFIFILFVLLIITSLFIGISIWYKDSGYKLFAKKYTSEEIDSIVRNLPTYPYAESKPTSGFVKDEIKNYKLSDNTLEINSKKLFITKNTQFIKGEFISSSDGLSALGKNNDIEFIRYTQDGNYIITIEFSE